MFVTRASSAKRHRRSLHLLDRCLISSISLKPLPASFALTSKGPQLALERKIHHRINQLQYKIPKLVGKVGCEILDRYVRFKGPTLKVQYLQVSPTYLCRNGIPL